MMVASSRIRTRPYAIVEVYDFFQISFYDIYPILIYNSEKGPLKVAINTVPPPL